MRNKYQLGRRTDNSAGYNPLNGQYDMSPKGQGAKAMELQKKMRTEARARNMDMCGEPTYNVINGAESPPKEALLKAGRGSITSTPYSPMTSAYMAPQNPGYGKGEFTHGAGRAVRGNV